MEDVLPDLLFSKGELEAMPAVSLLVFLPLKESFQPEEIQMLERMLAALNYRPGSWRFLYHEGQPDWNLAAEEGAEVFFFAGKGSRDHRPARKESAKGSWFSLPSLSAIFSDQVLKREVWDLIKR